MKDGSVVPFSFTLTAVNHNNNNAVFQSHYTINSVTSSDSGTYSCTVTNPIGSDSKATIVVVLIGELTDLQQLSMSTLSLLHISKCNEVNAQRDCIVWHL